MNGTVWLVLRHDLILNQIFRCGFGLSTSGRALRRPWIRRPQTHYAKGVGVRTGGKRSGADTRRVRSVVGVCVLAVVVFPNIDIGDPLMCVLVTF